MSVENFFQLISVAGPLLTKRCFSHMILTFDATFLRFSVRAKNYRSLLITRYVFKEAVYKNAEKNTYAELYKNEFFESDDVRTEAEMAMPFLIWFSCTESRVNIYTVFT